MPPAPRQSPALSPKTSGAIEARRDSAAAAALAARYGDPARFLTVFNPSRQVEFTDDLRRAYLGSAPTLGEVGRAWGRGTARSWVMVQLYDLAEFSGCRTKLTEGQFTELASLFTSTWGYLRITEAMHFFRRFKEGNYGKFYGSVDPMAITAAMQTFLTERAASLARWERLAAEERRRTDPEEIRWRRAYAADRRRRKCWAYHFRGTDVGFGEFRQELWWLWNMGYDSPEPQEWEKY